MCINHSSYFYLFVACTPSPADYNVTLTSKPVGVVIPHSERFAVPQSPAVSDNGSQISHSSTPNKHVSYSSYIYFLKVITY